MKVQGRTVGVLVAAAAVLGSAGGAYALTRPSDEPVQVNFVEPASGSTATTSTTGTSMPATAPATASVPVATSSTTSAPVASSTSSNRKATVQRQEATVTTQDTQPAPSSSTTPPAPDDPIRKTAPRPTPGNFTQGPPTSNAS